MTVAVVLGCVTRLTPGWWATQASRRSLQGGGPAFR